MSDVTVPGPGATERPEEEPIEVESRRWLEAVRRQAGPFELFDTHTHFGRNDPDGYRQEPSELLATMEAAGARAVFFPMHEPDGYRAANDEALAAAAESDGRLVPFCRVNPHDGALAEATRCLDAGARGIKLHPRAEQFAMSEPAVRDLVALADERRVPVLIHAGRGIPALGQDTVELAERYRGTRLILAHAAVSDIAWLWRLMPEHPNLFIDSSWWNPADFMLLFSLVPPGQILWASDCPYGLPIFSAAIHLRFALAAGLDHEALAAIAGGQIERLLAGEEPADLGPPPGPPGPQDLGLERVGSHLTTAMGRLMAEGEMTESVALARLALDRDGAYPAVCEEISHLLDLADANDGAPPAGRRFPRSAQFVMAALTVARTPDVALP
ncbi:MAG TPA: amidohydrolase family protein [Solirubrobacterales bacterium]|jgi:predicted TIM-barrel fold metal-dependent hydrolase